MIDLPETLEQLSSRVNALEKRILALEQSSGTITQPTLRPSAVASPMPATNPPSGEQVSSVFLLLGRSMLGIAGAYALRALAESGILPRLLVAAIAITYAIAWLVAASRTSAGARLAAVLYAATSALILAPMLWELTLRFNVLGAAGSAAILGLYAAAATALSWKEQRSPDFAVAYAAAALWALVLSVVTHEMISFLALLLAMVAVCEYKFLRTGVQGIRVLVGAAADCAVWFLLVIYRTPAATRADYPALGTVALIAPASLLFLVFAASVVFKTGALQRRITAFETVQSTVTFLLWTAGLMFLVPHFNSRIVGIVCLLFAAACYALAYVRFRHGPELRNFHVFASWSAALMLGGVFFSLTPAWAITFLALAAVISALLAVRLCCVTLEGHGILYLTVAAFACGLLEYSFHALAGALPTQVAWTIFLVSACALLCYVAAREHEGESWQLQVLHMVPALLMVLAITALTAQGSVWLVAHLITPDASHVAFIRTLVLCAIALVLAFAGSRSRRPELRRIAYATLVFVAAKLLFEDLRHGHLGFIAGSIFLFALTLIGVPRLARSAQRGIGVT